MPDDVLEQTHGGPDNVVDAIETEAEDIEQLAAQLTELHSITNERSTEILTKVDLCLTRMETLSTTSQSSDPMLIQVLAQLTEMRVDLESLKSSMDSRRLIPPPSESPEPETPEVSVNVDAPLEVEIPSAERVRKNRVI